MCNKDFGWVVDGTITRRTVHPITCYAPRATRLNAHEILSDVHRIGSVINGTVVDRTEIHMSHGFAGGYLTVDSADSEYETILPYQHLIDDQSAFSPNVIPNIGEAIKAAVFNFVDETLYLTAKPQDLTDEAIDSWRQFYQHVDTLTVGDTITGVVAKSMPFGLFVDIGSPYVGLIDIGHTAINRGVQLPGDLDSRPKVGEEIRCIIGYIRFRSRQVGLGWLPESGA